MLECCRNFNIKHLVYASSSSVYGANTKIPFSEKDRRENQVTKDINTRIFNGNSSVSGIGKLKNKNLPIIFSMARLDKIKNLTSLVRWYGENEELRILANLVIVAGKHNVEDSTDNEEKEQKNRLPYFQS